MGLDWAVVALYFALIAGVAWWSARHQETSKDYFLASRNVGWLVTG
jgi:SSS family solute:Na+ symporter